MSAGSVTRFTTAPCRCASAASRSIASTIAGLACSHWRDWHTASRGRTSSWTASFVPCRPKAKNAASSTVRVSRPMVSCIGLSNLSPAAPMKPKVGL